MIEFQIAGLPRTINSLGRTHWAVKAKEAKTWKYAVHLAVCEYRPEKPYLKAKVTMTRHSSKRPDFDGLVSSFKHVLDGLIDAKIIQDDSPEHVSTEYCWDKAGMKQGRIHVRIEPTT